MILLTLLGAKLNAQTIRGEAMDRGAKTRVPGVVILLLDSTGATVGRSLTDEDGQFRVSTSRAGSYRLRALRLGFRPVTTDAISLAVGQEATKVLELTGLPVSLDTIRVAGRNSCQVHPDSAAATFAIWEQVRTALTAAQLTEGSRRLGARLVRYERALQLARDRVLSQSSRITTGSTTRGWNAPPIDRLRTFGYAVTDAAGTTFYAPDLAVLLSDAFLEDHCFRLAEPPRTDMSLLGIEFEPTRDRRGVVEIRGTLWLNRRSSELQRLEFSYENLAREQQGTRAGGEMDFARIRNGAWVITRWSIRMPVVEAVEVARQGGGQRLSLATEAEARVTGIRVEGGELALVTRGRDTLWAQPPLALTGRVLDSLSGKGVADARVSLSGTVIEGKTDVEGRFRLGDVLPGEYELEVATPALRRLGATHSVPIAFTDSTVVGIVRVPSPEQIAAVLTGMVSDAKAQPIPDVEIAIPALSRNTFTNAQGTYRIGELPPGTHEVIARRVGYTPLTTRVTLRKGETVDWRITLAMAQTLDTVVVAEQPLIPSFEEHRRLGRGQFITRAQLASQEGRLLAEVLSTVQGLQVVRGGGRAAWVATGRQGTVSMTVVPDLGPVTDRAYCYAQVYLDEMWVNRGDPLFDINSVLTASVEAIEFYSGPSETPAKYSKMESRCGTLVIHTRRNRK